MARWLCLFLVSLLLLSTLVRVEAQEDEEDDDLEVDTELPRDYAQPKADAEPEAQFPTEGISGITILPEYSDARFPAGVQVDALIGFSNFNEQPFHVDYIRGMVKALAPPFPFIQNFSGALYNTTVRPGTESCLLYRFSADPTISSQEYELLIELYYTNADNETYMTVVHNGTVFVDEAPTSFGIQLVFAYLTLLGIAGAGGYGVWRFVRRNTRKSAPRARREESRESSAVSAASKDPVKKGEIDWDYVSPEHAKFLEKVRRHSPERAAPPASEKRKTSPNRKGRSSPSRKTEE
eukprot:GGOE01054649.1.p1 GENE.GGOE01054649.1~~GGOE01054649.1.p1  ORF type:complete len:310 (-),score=109.62 GGOE01054649.1:293-1174(-)